METRVGMCEPEPSMEQSVEEVSPMKEAPMQSAFVEDGNDIDSLIASRRAQLESLRARNRAMMESLVSSAPRFAEDSELRNSLDDLRNATNGTPTKRFQRRAASPELEEELSAAKRRIAELEAEVARARAEPPTVEGGVPILEAV